MTYGLLAATDPVLALDAVQWQDASWPLGAALALAERRGMWAAWAAAAARGAHLLDTLDAGDASLEALAESAAEEFRYARGLERADAMEAWLDVRGLDADAWYAALAREVLLERWSGLDVPAAPTAVSDPDVVRASLVVSPGTHDLVCALAVGIAVAVEAGLDPCDAGQPGTEAAERAWTAWASRVAGPEALRERIAAAGLRWTRVDVTRSWWPTRDAADEATWCVRDDQLDLAVVAAGGAAPAGRSEPFLDEVPPTLGTALLAAVPGEVVGPVDHVGGFVVAVLHAKHPPRGDDPAVRARARAGALAAASARLVEHHAVRVAWGGS